MKGKLLFSCSSPQGNEFISPHEQMQSLEAVPHIVREHGGHVVGPLLTNSQTNGFELVVDIECETEEMANNIGFRIDCYLGNMNFTRGTGSGYKWVPESTKACFVATAVYGSEDCPEVKTLRMFRDKKLLCHWSGTKAVQTYYSFGPTLAKLVKKFPPLKNAIRSLLDSFVRYLGKSSD